MFKDNKNNIPNAADLQMLAVCMSNVKHKRFLAVDENVQCGQQCMTSSAEFPFCKSNAQRQAATLKKLCLFAHHTIFSGHTICSKKICKKILLCMQVDA